MYVNRFSVTINVEIVDFNKTTGITLNFTREISAYSTQPNLEDLAKNLWFALLVDFYFHILYDQSF